jgi:plasmid stabilization system protein ParE
MAKRRIVWSPLAKIDQFQILDFFYKRNGNKIYSRKLYLKFKSTTKLLVNHPLIGLQTDIPNVRVVFEGDYAIFYRLNKGVIQILRIWDCNQDPTKLSMQ